MGLMEVIDHTGHSKHTWDSEVEAEVEAARAMFASLTGKGYRAFHVKRDGSEGEMMGSFDPDAESMILTPAMRGG